MTMQILPYALVESTVLQWTQCRLHMWRVYAHFLLLPRAQMLVCQSFLSAKWGCGLDVSCSHGNCYFTFLVLYLHQQNLPESEINVSAGLVDHRQACCEAQEDTLSSGGFLFIICILEPDHLSKNFSFLILNLHGCWGNGRLQPGDTYDRTLQVDRSFTIHFHAFPWYKCTRAYPMDILSGEGTQEATSLDVFLFLK